MAITESGMSTSMSNYQFVRFGTPQAGLHYDEHERICNTAWHEDPGMIMLMEGLVASQKIGYEQIQFSWKELQSFDEGKAKFIAKKIRRSLRAFGVEKIEYLVGQGFIFCAAGKRKISVLNLTDLSVAVISHKELFYYLKRMRKGLTANAGMFWVVGQGSQGMWIPDYSALEDQVGEL